MKRILRYELSYFLLGSLAFAYVLIRAFTLDITYDEAWTIDQFSRLPVKDILAYNPPDANNHLINTLLAKLCVALNGDDRILSRMPNVATFLLYLWYAYRTSRLTKGKLAQIAGFILLTANPFLLDFFSLARGYGIALAFQLASLYHFIRFVQAPAFKHAAWGLLFATLSVIGLFSMLDYYLSIVLLMFLFAAAFDKGSRIKTLILCCISFTITTLLISAPLLKLKANGKLYYGGHSGFYSDTLVSLTKYCLYGGVSLITAQIVLCVFLAVLLYFITCFYLKKHEAETLRTHKSISLLILLPVGMEVARHHLLGGFYLSDRSALFYYPLLITIIILSFSNSKAKTVILTMVTACFAINFFAHGNFYRTALWYYDAHTTRILQRLNEEGKRQHKPVALDYSWPFERSLWFYLGRDQYPYVKLAKSTDDPYAVNPAADYYLYLGTVPEKTNYDAATEKINFVFTDTALSFPKEHVHLLSKIH